MNTYGPQTRPEGIQGSGHKPSSMLRDCGNQAVEERLQNIEAHLRLQAGKQSAEQCPITLTLQVAKGIPVHLVTKFSLSTCHVQDIVLDLAGVAHLDECHPV